MSLQGGPQRLQARLRRRGIARPCRARFAPRANGAAPATGRSAVAPRRRRRGGNGPAGDGCRSRLHGGLSSGACECVLVARSGSGAPEWRKRTHQRQQAARRLPELVTAPGGGARRGARPRLGPATGRIRYRGSGGPKQPKGLRPLRLRGLPGRTQARKAQPIGARASRRCGSCARSSTGGAHATAWSPGAALRSRDARSWAVRSSSSLGKAGPQIAGASSP